MRRLLARLHRSDEAQMAAEWVLVATVVLVLSAGASAAIMSIIYHQFYRTATLISMPIF